MQNLYSLVKPLKTAVLYNNLTRNHMQLFLLQHQEIQANDIESNCLVIPALDNAAKVQFLSSLKLLLDRDSERIREDQRFMVRGYWGGSDPKLDARDQDSTGGGDDKAQEDQWRGRGPWKEQWLQDKEARCCLCCYLGMTLSRPQAEGESPSSISVSQSREGVEQLRGLRGAVGSRAALWC